MKTPLLLAALLALTPAVHAHYEATPGSLVSLSVEVGGGLTPLHRAPDGSGRFYFEARAGEPYALQVANRTGQRVAVLLLVDGINVISGVRETIPAGAARPGRMYVLGPWESLPVRGWRSSLEAVQQFTFVDERASYAARSGQDNGHLGWVEMAVYRERPRPVVATPPAPVTREHAEGERPQGFEGQAQPRAEAKARDEAAGAAAPRSYPGTGWGQALDDRAVVVSFEAEAYPAERATLRYEYRRALRALGIDLRPHHDERARLWERDRGDGFARPPY